MKEYKKAFLFNGIGTNPEKLLKAFTPELAEKYNTYHDEEFRRLGLDPDPEKNSEADRNIIKWIKNMISDRVIFEHYIENGVIPDIGAGYSSGIMSICACFGAISHENAARALLANRPTLKSVSESGTKLDMGLIIGMDHESVQEIISGSYSDNEVAVGSANSIICTMISGYAEAVEDILQKAEAEGALKLIRFNTGLAYHHPIMEKHSGEYSAFFDTVRFSDPKYPVMSIFDRTIMTKADQLRHENQINVYTPIRWDLTIKKLEELGVTEFFDVSANGEIGKFTRVNKRKCKIYTYSEI